jgi:CrcB protein
MMSWLVHLGTHPVTLIGIGGAFGANARYWIGMWFRAQPWAKEFMWGTFTINVTGSLLLGVIAAVWKDRASPYFLLLGTGFCGGYTTFSTFSLEVAEAIHRNRFDMALLYASSSVFAGFIAFTLATLLMKS